MIFAEPLGEEKGFGMMSPFSKLGLPGAGGVLQSLQELERTRNVLAEKLRSFQDMGGRKLRMGNEPARNKVHWDYLLEEMEWMSNDFKRECKWQVDQGKKIAKAVQVCVCVCVCVCVRSLVRWFFSLTFCGTEPLTRSVARARALSPRSHITNANATKERPLRRRRSLSGRSWRTT